MRGAREQVGWDAADDRALALALRHVNASACRPLAVSELCEAIATGFIREDVQNEIYAFVDETDLPTLCDIVISGAATYGDLARLADQILPPGHRNRRWLDERRDV